MEKHKNEFQPKHNDFNSLILWIILLLMYIFLLTSIGYIAFWNQDFNKPEKLLGEYEKLRGKHIETIKKAYGVPDSVQLTDSSIINDDFNVMLNQSIESTINSFGDLQELASQSFNIVLGAVLAFLSATATMIIQNSDRK